MIKVYLRLPYSEYLKPAQFESMPHIGESIIVEDGLVNQVIVRICKMEKIKKDKIKSEYSESMHISKIIYVYEKSSQSFIAQITLKWCKHTEECFKEYLINNTKKSFKHK